MKVSPNIRVKGAGKQYGGYRHVFGFSVILDASTKREVSRDEWNNVCEFIEIRVEGRSFLLL